MLALVIVLAVGILIAVPGFVLIFGLCRAAALESPAPGNTAPIRRPSHDHPIVGRTQTWRNRDTIRRRLARANYN